jgi:predicted nucleic acid-binding protein
VALLSANDANHARARQLFAECVPPLRCCEAVVAEACFLMRKVDRAGPAAVVALGRRGVYRLGMSLEEHRASVEGLLRKYADRPISLADACLIRCAEIHHEPRILTFDRDFAVYRWARTRRFEVVASEGGSRAAGPCRGQPRWRRSPVGFAVTSAPAARAPVALDIDVLP